MNEILVTILSISLIFLGTTFGSFFVFFIKNKLSDRVSDIIMGFAGGIMVAAAIFGLMNPSIEDAQANYGDLAVLPVVIGFVLGGIILFILDKAIPHFHIGSGNEEGPKTTTISKEIKFLFAVTIHNIPEGLAVGFACGLALINKDPIAISGALSLAIGVTIQNIPEGAAVSIPLLETGMSKWKSFLHGTLTGIVEPIFAVIGLFIATQLTMIMPWLLSFAAGAMIYVTIDEILPAARKGGHEHIGLWSFMIGFSMMLILELCL